MSAGLILVGFVLGVLVGIIAGVTFGWVAFSGVYDGNQESKRKEGHCSEVEACHGRRPPP